MDLEMSRRKHEGLDWLYYYQQEILKSQYNKPRHTHGTECEKARTNPKLNDETLSSDPDIKEAYKAGVMKMLKVNTNGNLQWDLSREALVKNNQRSDP